MCDRYNYVYYLTLYVVATGIKWADLVKQSTMIHIELYPREVRGQIHNEVHADVLSF
jgi:hypothetical protein